MENPLSQSLDNSAHRAGASTTIDADLYRTALRRHPAGVTIITLDSANGPVGFTATSFSSLSLNPPLVSFNIAHTSSSISALHQAQSLIVHLVGDHQLPLAQRFSASADQRFADESAWVTLSTGEPLLRDTHCWLRTGVHQLIEAGDHTLVIGAVEEIHIDDADGTSDAAPLLYHEGRYHRAVPFGS
ncbi:MULTISPECIES: flavin reductase family protein [Rhodococcus]|uniref:Flavin reductase family protein n=1 Tax=Rhodococcus oxybenzonivorans TaxID=1990687 RepID=A0AAE4UWC4_9NOCA|nr:MULTISPECIES: flavin reductase family protein [Rhodococcus]MDV7241578.1 flavin reductase family protein [Rhodococcus oxybenzonivorans]MDV7264163.1 flavin reductase family protein [Rhodococcus oxybenzonivorans]MDV7273889.1 flavin reductase family protein [Rhodococcus oxybenzonivorans]MDV7333859.1 flavin reductase family protein [Rhodococcus oxybenzonivorans]MDV7343278.1 flavin reductase family protein [Rhodococcus oxybenzonivorans]